MDYLTMGKGGFYLVFLLSPLQCTLEAVRGCVSLMKFSRQSCRGNCEQQGGKLCRGGYFLLPNRE